MVIVHDTLFHCALEVNAVSTKKLLQCSSYRRDKGNNLKNKHARVMVLLPDTSSECVLQMHEVSIKYVLRLSSYRANIK